LHDIYKQIYGDALDLRNERDQFYPDREFLMPLNLEFPDHIRGIHAHLTVEQVRPIIEKYNPKVIVWLRDPVDRVISNYYFFMKRIRQGRAPERQLRKKDVTLLEYARKPRKTNKISDFLKGMELEDFFFIGLLERFEEDILELASKMGWTQQITFPHTNSNVDFKLNNDCKTQYKDIDEKMRQEIARLNHIDVKLYNDVKKMRGIE